MMKTDRPLLDWCKPREVTFLVEGDARKFANGRKISDGAGGWIEVAPGAKRFRRGNVVTIIPNYLKQQTPLIVR